MFRGGSSGVGIGNVVAGGTATRILFLGTGGVLDDSALLVFDEATVRLTVGTGGAGSAGVRIGNIASGTSYIISTGQTDSQANAALVMANGGATTNLQAPSGGVIQIVFNNATVKQSWADTAGAGPSITAGTATTDVNALSHTQTWNNGAVTFTGDKGNVTVTAAANGSKVLDRQANGGSMFAVAYYAANVTAAAGPTVTATNLIPAKSNLIGIATRVTTTLSGSAATGYTVGDGSDADRWGVASTVTAGTVTDQDDATADPRGWFGSANNVVLTSVGADFGGTGVIRVIASVITMQAPTS